ncbi:MAG: hypothetical protein LBV60_18575 [Streptomyces sp.]|jgi:hypothetical protein|nr:hypothetical protein [Streptomyces sp.]
MALSRVTTTLWQWRHPREFRILGPALRAPATEWIDELLALVDAAETTAPDTPGARVGAATAVWRALRMLERGKGELSTAERRQVRRYVQASRQALADDGVEVYDHDGAAFHPGQSLEVLDFQDEPGLDRPTVLRTERPSVFYRGERIQMGKVVVGRPPGDSPQDTGNGKEADRARND